MTGREGSALAFLWPFRATLFHIFKLAVGFRGRIKPSTDGLVIVEFIEYVNVLTTDNFGLASNLKVTDYETLSGRWYFEKEVNER